jgi:hypothetical protein
MISFVDARQRVFWERRFYTGMALLVLASVFLGFARTYFLKPWFPGAQQFAPPEPFFFYVHGVSFTAWILLLVLQPLLVASKRVDLHRVVGWFGAGLAVVVVVVGTMGALMAARRPGGFIGVTMPPLQFLTVPLADLALFAVFVVFAIVKRRDTQGHKRFMLLATIGLLDAAVVRWPFGDMNAAVAGSLFTRADIGVDLFLVPMIVWDLLSRGRVHRVTLFGGLAVIASQPLRLMLSGTDLWMSFASWAVGAS